MPTKTSPVSQLIQLWLNLFEEWKGAADDNKFLIQSLLDQTSNKIGNSCQWMVTDTRLVTIFEVDQDLVDDFLADHGPYPTCPF